MLKIGLVAKRTGLTVRTLHHYDEIGLLTPSHRTDAGYRLYTRDDLLRLQKIKSLQQLGFSLEKIGVLVGSSEPLPVVLKQHIANLHAEVEQQQALLERLRTLADILESKHEPSIDFLLDTLRLTVMFEKYYSKEQLQQLEERRKQLGEESIQQVQLEWQTLFEQFRQLYQLNQPASCEAAQKIAKRSLELIELFTGGDPGISQSLQNLYKNEGGGDVLAQSGMGVEKEIFSYFSEAMEIARKS